MQYYTITQASEELGISRNKILNLVRKGKVASIKGKERRSPYKIPRTELKKLFELATSENPVEEQKVILNEEIKVKPTNIPHENNYHDVVQMQKVLMETMRHLATTQDKIASTLAYLAKKL